MITSPRCYLSSKKKRSLNVQTGTASLWVIETLVKKKGGVKMSFSSTPPILGKVLKTKVDRMI